MMIMVVMAPRGTAVGSQRSSAGLRHQSPAPSSFGPDPRRYAAAARWCSTVRAASLLGVLVSSAGRFPCDFLY